MRQKGLFNFLKKEERIIERFDRDFWHHLLLMLILGSGVVVFYLVSYSRFLQFLTGAFVSIIYVFWGIIHHKLDGDLHFKNMVEYIFIAIFAIIVLGGLLI